jgi:hypothetical protein
MLKAGIDAHMYNIHIRNDLVGIATLPEMPRIINRKRDEQGQGK